MKVKSTFLAKNVSIKAFNGVTMLLFPHRIKKDVGRMLLSKLTTLDVGSSSTLIGYCGAYERYSRKKFNFLNSSYARICTRVYIRASYAPNASKMLLIRV